MLTNPIPYYVEMKSIRFGEVSSISRGVELYPVQQCSAERKYVSYLENSLYKLGAKLNCKTVGVFVETGSESNHENTNHRRYSSICGQVPLGASAGFGNAGGTVCPCSILLGRGSAVHARNRSKALWRFTSTAPARSLCRSLSCSSSAVECPSLRNPLCPVPVSCTRLVKYKVQIHRFHLTLSRQSNIWPSLNATFERSNWHGFWVNDATHSPRALIGFHPQTCLATDWFSTHLTHLRRLVHSSHGKNQSMRNESGTIQDYKKWISNILQDIWASSREWEPRLPKTCGKTGSYIALLPVCSDASPAQVFSPNTFLYFTLDGARPFALN